MIFDAGHDIQLISPFDAKIHIEMNVLVTQWDNLLIFALEIPFIEHFYVRKHMDSCQSPWLLCSIRNCSKSIFWLPWTGSFSLNTFISFSLPLFEDNTSRDRKILFILRIVILLKKWLRTKSTQLSLSFLNKYVTKRLRNKH